MIKKISPLVLFIFLTNCSAPGTAFFSPVFTGVKTGSVYQASLSYGGNKIVHNLMNIKDTKSFQKINTFIENQKNIMSAPIILTSLAVAKIEISEVLEPEPLP